MTSIAESREYREYGDAPYGGETYRRQPSRRRPGFMTAPFEGRVWRESLHMLVNLPVGIVTFTFAVPMLVLGLGTVLTFIGLPVLAAAVLGCLGFGAMERGRARATLDLDLRGRPGRRPSGDTDRHGLMAWAKAALGSGAGWRSVLYSVLMLPFGVLSFSLTLTLWITGIGYASYPLWQWVFPTYVNVPGLQLYENDGHTVYLSSVPQIAGVCAAGLLVMFLTPWVVRGLAAVQRSMVRGLLG
ncbi:sensor domain-containing protein [Streptacidiphilus cavernicola]|uniref:Sensor domain-containing protein n=1 Tax=Streptacidiphilus cavernicola TaxID=3342716 RepID=A0ABV6W4L9_9ACTN